MDNPAPFSYHSLFTLAADLPIQWRRLGDNGGEIVTLKGKEFLWLPAQRLTELTQQAFHDVSFYLRRAHLNQLTSILDDQEASDNDKYVAFSLLKNAGIAAQGLLPMCQDTGTAIIHGKKGQGILIDGNMEKAFAQGVYNTYTQYNLRYSQMAPLTTFDEHNTQNNLPAQIDIYAEADENKSLEFSLQFIAKGGGSANKTFLFQQTRSLLSSKEYLLHWLLDQLKTLGTSACPPYHLAIVLGGLSAEQTLKTVKLASTHALDTLPTTGNAEGRAFRDTDLENALLSLTQNIGIGAQFGGKYYCHDVRVIRLPRHGASFPVGIGVSCSADRQINARISPDGLFIEDLEKDPALLLDKRAVQRVEQNLDRATIEVDLRQPIQTICAQLSTYPVGTRLSLSGPMIVARDIAHARFHHLIVSGKPLPDYLHHHPIYYAGPAKTPEGAPTGSFGPTTAGRMDQYCEELQQRGISLISLAKGNRSTQVKKSCKHYGGFYLGSIGGAAADLAQNHITKVEILDYPELGMEAVWKIEVNKVPAFIVIDDKGNDFYEAIF